jgi:DNA-binding Lrp family transcriptional regulator
MSIDPSIRQTQLASELGVTRSAVNQIWRKLEHDYNLRIVSNLDYKSIGFHLIYGWAVTRSDKDSLTKFETWVENNQYSTTILKSQITSKMDNRILFESLVPEGTEFRNYLGTLERFRKKPYSLELTYDTASHVANHFNFGHYDGFNWTFQADFRFEASIDAAKQYADILPVGQSRRQGSIQDASLQDIVIASALETNYFCTSSDLTNIMSRLGLDMPSERTLRRKISKLRTSIAQPYLSLDNIGLTRMIAITIEVSEQSNISKLLRSQAVTLPKVRVLSGLDSIVLLLDLPPTTDLFHISNAMTHLVKTPSEICTFIAEQGRDRRWLQNIVSGITSEARRKKKTR